MEHAHSKEFYKELAQYCLLDKHLLNLLEPQDIDTTKNLYSCENLCEKLQKPSSACVVNPLNI